MRASVILPSLAALITISAAASIPGLPSCAGSCVGTDFGGCGSLNVQCICSNTALISSLACCVSTACDQADQEATIQFADALCAGYSITNLPTAATCASTSGASSTGTGTAAAAGTSATGSSSSASITATGSAASSASSSLSSALSSASAAAATITSSAASASSASHASTSSAAASSTHASSSAAAAASSAAAGNWAGKGAAGLGLGAVIAGALAIL